MYCLLVTNEIPTEETEEGTVIIISSLLCLSIVNYNIRHSPTSSAMVQDT